MSVESHVCMVPNVCAYMKWKFTEREKQRALGMFANYGIPTQLRKDIEPQPVSVYAPFVLE